MIERTGVRFAVEGVCGEEAWGEDDTETFTGTKASWARLGVDT
jgi:hypothetical protein